MNTHSLTRREFLKASLAALSSAALPPLDGLSPSPRSSPFHQSTNQQSTNLLAPNSPNLIIILSDQLRAASLGCYGNPEIDTPNLDRLAAEGARFVNSVTTSPLCSPARACLMTGRYPNKTGIIINNLRLPKSEISVAEVMRNAGYLTGYIGKWHLDGMPPRQYLDPGWVEPKNRQGFQGWTAFNTGHVYYNGHYYKGNDPTMLTIPDGIYEPDFQTDEAISFITTNAGRPFFLFLSIGTPHPQNIGRDLPPGGDYTFPYDADSLTLRPNVDYPDLAAVRQEYADYYGIVSNFDWNVGRILTILDNLGLAENTIVAITSDHGDYLGSHYNVKLRGKLVIYAESLDVPFILRYPHRVAPQLVNDVFTSVDVMPTLLGMCGLSSPSQVMGRDFTPLLKAGEPPLDPPYGPVPSTEAAFVNMLDGECIWIGVRTPEYTLECDRYTYEPKRLFHNSIDPYQLVNYLDDPAYAQVKEDLYQQLLAWVEYIGL